MAVIVKYVVIRNGKEDMTFATKKEADAYDRMLDIAEGLYEFIHTSDIEIADDKLDELTFFMAKHRDQLGKLLKGGKLDGSDVSNKEMGNKDISDKEAESATAATKGKVAERAPAKDEKADPEARPSRVSKPKSVAA